MTPGYEGDDKQNEEYTFYYENDNVKAYKHKRTGVRIELCSKIFGKPEEILSQFDFSITKFAYYKAIIEDETGAEREMNTTVLGAVATSGSTTADATINQQLYAEFGAHLKKTRELVTNKINATGVNRYGTANGCTNGWEWIDAQAILMSEVELYGSIVWSSAAWDTGNANHQFELFANSKSAINDRSAWYWLKDVASASEFCYCSNGGYSSYSGASGAGSCVRPRFVIAA